jgi:hypothetical protein
VSSSHRMMTHHLGITFGNKNLGRRAFPIVEYLFELVKSY